MSTESSRQAGRRHYAKNKEARKSAAKKWRSENRERYNAYMRDLRAKKATG